MSLEQIALEEGDKPAYVPTVYAQPVQSFKPYSGYRNRSSVVDIVMGPIHSYRDLCNDSVLGWCYNLGKIIELNRKLLHGDLDKFHEVHRHELRHSVSGISDSTAIGDYIMRALDATARAAKSRYDRESVYRQAA